MHCDACTIGNLAMHDQQLRFINEFVDSVTVRPFLEDLRRSRQLSMMLARLPQIARTRPAPASSAAA